MQAPLNAGHEHYEFLVVVAMVLKIVQNNFIINKEIKMRKNHVLL